MACNALAVFVLKNMESYWKLSEAAVLKSGERQQYFEKNGSFKNCMLSYVNEESC